MATQMQKCTATDDMSEELASDCSFADVSLQNNSNLSDFNISEDENPNPDIRDQIIEEIMRLYSRHNLTKIAVEDIAKLVNKIPGATKIPDTTFTIFKEFLKKSPFKIYHNRFCPKCKQMTKHDFSSIYVKCDICNADLKKVKISYIHLSLAPQLTRIISRHFEEIIAYEKKCIERSGGICDVHDGKLLKNLAEKQTIYSLILNTDGVEMHNSSNSTLWPILLVCNFLPPEIRFREKNMIVAALHYDVGKPDFLTYMDPLVEEFDHLTNDGLIIKSKCFKFVVSHASLDLPAKSTIQCITQYNGYSACSYCIHPGEKTKSGIRYTDGIYPPRSHSDMICDIQKVLMKNTVVNGVKGLSPMVGFIHFDMVDSFIIDYMHATLLGIANTMLNFWWDSEYNKQPFYILPKSKRIVNQRMANIKPCRFINRRIESFDKYKKFKASQYRSFLLYFYPVLSGFLERRHYNHFRLLSSSIYQLLQPEISTEQLNSTRKNLRQFVTDYQSLYGKTQMTMNIHNLTHLVDCVEKMGPLWSYSMFSFESYNGKLKSYAHKSTNVVNQIVEKFVMQHYKNEEIETKKSEHLGDEVTKSFLIKLDERKLIEVYGAVDTCKFYTTFDRGSVKYTSQMYTRANKTMDYFVSMVHGELGKIKYFIECGNEKYALIDEYTLEKQIDQFKEVTPQLNMIIKPVSEIMDKHIYMKFGLKELIVRRPNPYELN